jgi:cytosine/adenosine deaminase-related metal-dependent hydrolase
MLTLHTADLLLPGGDGAPVPGGAVLVDGAVIGAVGPYDELAAAHPTARTRRWPGLLTRALLNPYGPELLEQAYHPDPREADDFAHGTDPVTGPDLERLALDDTRWGAGARRGLQRMLAHGTVAVGFPPEGPVRPSVREALRRSGLVMGTRAAVPPGVPALDPYASGAPVTHLHHLAPRNHARFAVFDVRDEAELAERGAGTCVATVLDGRLVFRRR